MPAGAFFRLGRRPPVTHTRTSSSPPRCRPARALHARRARLWLVGGAVRDLASGRTPVRPRYRRAADARAAADAIAASLGGTAFPLDRARRARVALADASTVAYIDVSSFAERHRSRPGAARLHDRRHGGAVQPGGELGAVLDPHGGLDRPRRAHRVRMVSAAMFEDDPLRLLRGVRLAVELDAEIEAATFDGHAQPRRAAGAARPLSASATSSCACSRRLVAPARCVCWTALGLLRQVLPELTPARERRQPTSHHYWDVFNHSVETLAALDQMLAPEPSRLRSATSSTHRW